MARFEDALASNPAPPSLGDVALRYEPSMLIGETPKGRRTWRPTASWLVGISSLLGGVGALLSPLEVLVGAVFAVVGGLAIAFAVWLERFEKRQRRFIANFATYTLRLDFASAIAGYPRTLNVPFDDVRDCALMTQADGHHCLVVDFVRVDRMLREVLVAHVASSELEAAERLQRVLHGAFGLGEAPADSPAFADESTFQ